MKAFSGHVLGVLLTASLSAAAATFTVNITADAGAGSLREALLSANALPDADTITFDLPGLGAYRIALQSPLPEITCPVVIDGCTQPGFTGTPLVVIEGNLIQPAADGFVIRGGQSAVRGLAFTGFGHAAIVLRTNGMNVVQGNLIGIAPASFAPPNGTGIILQYSSGNYIGAVDQFDPNVISGNECGIRIVGGSQNVIAGNFIGTDPSGALALGNGNGIVIEAGSADNTIGGSSPVLRNIISGNNTNGLWFIAAIRNSVFGNFIGVDHTGRNPLGNQLNGVLFDAGSQYNVLGGSDPGATNVISANGGAGVLLQGAGATDNFVQGNIIGLNATALAPLPNFVGVAIMDGAYANLIGGSAPGEGNLISGNCGPGIRLSGMDTTVNLVQGNWVGTDRTGNAETGNWGPGISIANSAQYNQVGGTEPGQGNRISYNNGDGVVVQDEGTTGNSVFGNAIFSNRGLGLNLLQSGENPGTVTTNDILDTDIGPNNLQNFPTVTNLSYATGSNRIQGYLRSRTNSSYALDFYFNAAPEPCTYGEGQIYLGYTTVRTDGAGVAGFDFSTSGTYSNHFVTATATDLVSGDTSEFSAGFGGFVILSCWRAGNDWQLLLANSPGLFYRLERTPYLPATNWSTVPNLGRVAGTGTPLTLTDVGGALGPSMFYRLQVVP